MFNGKEMATKKNKKWYQYFQAFDPDNDPNNETKYASYAGWGSWRGSKPKDNEKTRTAMQRKYIGKGGSRFPILIGLCVIGVIISGFSYKFATDENNKIGNKFGNIKETHAHRAQYSGASIIGLTIVLMVGEYLKNVEDEGAVSWTSWLFAVTTVGLAIGFLSAAFIEGNKYQWSIYSGAGENYRRTTNDPTGILTQRSYDDAVKAKKYWDDNEKALSEIIENYRNIRFENGKFSLDSQFKLPTCNLVAWNEQSEHCPMYQYEQGGECPDHQKEDCHEFDEEKNGGTGSCLVEQKESSTGTVEFMTGPEERIPYVNKTILANEGPSEYFKPIWDKTLTYAEAADVSFEDKYKKRLGLTKEIMEEWEKVDPSVVYPQILDLHKEELEKVRSTFPLSDEKRFMVNAPKKHLYLDRTFNPKWVGFLIMGTCLSCLTIWNLFSTQNLEFGEILGLESGKYYLPSYIGMHGPIDMTPVEDKHKKMSDDLDKQRIKRLQQKLMEPEKNPIIQAEVATRIQSKKENSPILYHTFSNLYEKIENELIFSKDVDINDNDDEERIMVKYPKPDNQTIYVYKNVIELGTQDNKKVTIKINNDLEELSPEMFRIGNKLLEKAKRKLENASKQVKILEEKIKIKIKEIENAKAQERVTFDTWTTRYRSLWEDASKEQEIAERGALSSQLERYFIKRDAQDDKIFDLIDSLADLENEHMNAFNYLTQKRKDYLNKDEKKEYDRKALKLAKAWETLLKETYSEVAKISDNDEHSLARVESKWKSRVNEISRKGDTQKRKMEADEKFLEKKLQELRSM